MQKLRKWIQCQMQKLRKWIQNKVGLYIRDEFFNFICPFFCPLDFQAMRKKKKKPNQFLVSESVRLQAKDGTRTRDIHLGKVELYH